MLRKPDSISASDTVITDPALEPFFVSRSQTGGYTLYERVIKGDNNTEYIKTICYPSNFNGALKVVAREKLNSGTQKVYNSLQEYIAKWKDIQTAMETMTTIDL